MGRTLAVSPLCQKQQVGLLIFGETLEGGGRGVEGAAGEEGCSDKAGSWKTDPSPTSDTERHWNWDLKDLGLTKFGVGKGFVELELAIGLELGL